MAPSAEECVEKAKVCFETRLVRTRSKIISMTQAGEKTFADCEKILQLLREMRRDCQAGEIAQQETLLTAVFNEMGN